MSACGIVRYGTRGGYWIKRTRDDVVVMIECEMFLIFLRHDGTAPALWLKYEKRDFSPRNLRT